MRIGVFSQAAGRPAARVDDVVAEARAAEAEGFAFVAYPHVFGFDAPTIAALAGRATSRVELVTAVVPAPPRHPVALAQQARTVQAACGGRFRLGVGLSHRVVVEDLLGLSYARPAAQMREYLGVLAPLLRGESVSFEGDVHRVRAQLDTPGIEAVPLLVAALGPRMLAVAGALADGTITWMCGFRTLAEHIVPALGASARSAGRPAPRVIAALPIALVRDADAARADARRRFAVYDTLPSYRAMLDREGRDVHPGDVVLLGDEGTLRASLSRLRDAGVTDLCAVLFGSEPGSASRTRAFLAAQP